MRMRKHKTMSYNKPLYTEKRLYVLIATRGVAIVDVGGSTPGFSHTRILANLGTCTGVAALATELRVGLGLQVACIAR